jgi:hypothetical protein
VSNGVIYPVDHVLMPTFVAAAEPAPEPDAAPAVKPAGKAAARKK